MRAYNPMKKRKCASAMAGEQNRHPRPPAATYPPQVSREHYLDQRVRDLDRLAEKGYALFECPTTVPTFAPAVIQNSAR
jgi:hypothetical protein